MAKMNIPLSKDQIMKVLQIDKLPRNWKRNGYELTRQDGIYSFASGYALSMFADGLLILAKNHSNADWDSLFVGLFSVLSGNFPNLFAKID